VLLSFDDGESQGASPPFGEVRVALACAVFFAALAVLALACGSWSRKRPVRGSGGGGVSVLRDDGKQRSGSSAVRRSVACFRRLRPALASFGGLLLPY